MKTLFVIIFLSTTAVNLAQTESDTTKSPDFITETNTVFAYPRIGFAVVGLLGLLGGSYMMSEASNLESEADKISYLEDQAAKKRDEAKELRNSGWGLYIVALASGGLSLIFHLLDRLATYGSD
ncbi:MAG: hypothetical protein AB9882_09295 [Ignavibacteriaceae bacterium]